MFPICLLIAGIWVPKTVAICFCVGQMVSFSSFVALMDAAVRSAEAYELQLPLDWVGDVVHSWIVVVSADGKLVSDTTYVGQLTVV
ncbi:DUF6266 family protein [Pedobacter frigoris]|uniref:Uncharacterized protein n=1 Tax=Pedobacter frigoris TaxID=2571272 RepID=A0A4U1CLV5_9SPHI|nr:DUF6266 family protein [Pedobacter frigoris]TKC08817.1 hypothetical protein FA047_01590 [Pedobacter frigoris]